MLYSELDIEVTPEHIEAYTYRAVKSALPRGYAYLNATRTESGWTVFACDAADAVLGAWTIAQHSLAGGPSVSVVADLSALLAGLS